MNTDNKIFILIVTYNGSKWIEKVFSKFINLPENWEVVVVDNCSTDNTIEYLEKNYPFVKIIKSNENLGFGKANNLGLNYILKNKPDNVLLLNQDAWIDVEDIKKLVELQNENPDYYVLSPIHYDGQEKDLDRGFTIYIKESLPIINDAIIGKYSQKIYSVDFVNAACWLLSRNCLEEIGGFNPSFYHYGEDNNYIDRLNYIGKNIGVVPSTKVFHDRKQRKANKFFIDNKIIEYRTYLINITNPNNPNYIFIKKFFELILKMIGNLFIFNFKRVLHYFSIFKLYSANYSSIKQNTLTSKRKGRNFIGDRI